MFNWKDKIMVKYSILVPVYNKKECLQKYFKYIQNQTYNNYEIIAVDDNSNDGSYEYLLSLNDEKLHVYKNENNVGIGEIRNILLNYCHGEYVIFIDPDDYIDVNLLLKIDEVNNDLDIVRFQNVIEPMTETQKKNEQGKDKYRFCCNPTEIIDGEEALLTWCLGERKINTFPWTYAIKRELYQDVEYPKVQILEDFAITPYLLAKAKKIKAISFVGYHYLLYDESLTKQKNNSKYAKMKIQLLKEIIELAKYYIYKTEISENAKQIFVDDINNRYEIRKKKVLELEQH